MTRTPFAAITAMSTTEKAVIAAITSITGKAAAVADMGIMAEKVTAAVMDATSVLTRSFSLSCEMCAGQYTRRAADLFY